MPFRVSQYFDMKAIRTKSNSSHIEKWWNYIFVTISEIIGNSVVISNASISDSNILCIFPEKSKHQSCPSVNSVIQCILAWSDMPIIVT